MTELAARTVAAAAPAATLRRLTESRLIEVLLVLYFPLMIAARWISLSIPSA